MIATGRKIERPGRTPSLRQTMRLLGGEEDAEYESRAGTGDWSAGSGGGAGGAVRVVLARAGAAAERVTASRDGHVRLN